MDYLTCNSTVTVLRTPAQSVSRKVEEDSERHKKTVVVLIVERQRNCEKQEELIKNHETKRLVVDLTE